MEKLRVAELFAGVGGFRIGLEGYNGKSASSNYTKRLKPKFQVIYANQWEPTKKKQTAFNIYTKNFTQGIHSNKNISDVSAEEIPFCEILCGGFPCQDYSVATTLKNSRGIIGKKGILWWEIERLISERKENEKPKILLFENVDRILKSPSNQKGRDFAILLASLRNLNYTVEWKVINSAEYGAAQRRKRTFILAYNNASFNPHFLPLINKNWYLEHSILNKAFPGEIINERNIVFADEKLTSISTNFNTQNTLFKKFKSNPFLNSGYITNNEIITFNQKPKYKGPFKTLNDVIQPLKEVDSKFIIEENDLKKWITLKGSKSIIKTNKEGIKYKFTEGAIAFPDSLEKPSRTIITGEGGKTPTRTKHVIKQNNIFRRLTPLELERLNGFPDNFTQIEESTDTERAFFMGNALVINIVEKIGISISDYINQSK